MTILLFACQIRGSSDTLNLSARKALALEVDQIFSIANSVDKNGNFIYGGILSIINTITQTGDTYVYNGDQEQRSLDISDGLQIAVNTSGYDLFMDLLNSNGDFTVMEGWDVTNSNSPEYPFRFLGIPPNSDGTKPNTGTKSISSTLIYDRDTYIRNIEDYFIQFDTTTSPTKYRVYDSDGATIVDTSTFSTDTPIRFRGMFAPTGSIANCDRFHLNPTPKESMFETIQSMGTTLNRPISTKAEQHIVSAEYEHIFF